MAQDISFSKEFSTPEQREQHAREMQVKHHEMIEAVKTADEASMRAHVISAKMFEYRMSFNLFFINNDGAT